jgi:tripeptide aminopeptidase
MCKLAFGLLFAAMAVAQDLDTLLEDPTVKAALEIARRDEPHFIDEQARICEIAAPPFKEDARGRELERLFRAAGLRDVRRDRTGNVIGVRPGARARPNAVIAAHLDTVFPAPSVKVARMGAVLQGRGIADDCRGLAVLLAAVHALDEANVRTPGTITFVADTGEEGLGDLRGMKTLFAETLKGQIDSFVSVDGSGLGVVNRGVGSLRYRVTFTGSGGHSYGAFGNANPIQAMGRAITKIDAIEVPAHPKTTFNVGRVGGGTSVNAIPFECWMEVDLRSQEKEALEKLHNKFIAAVAEATAEENKRWNNQGAVTVRLERVGDRPAGLTPESSAIVQSALAITKIFGAVATLEDSSTDANVPMSLGIPAITIGGGGRGESTHSPQESWDSSDSFLGTQRALALMVALAR